MDYNRESRLGDRPPERRARSTWPRHDPFPHFRGGPRVAAAILGRQWEGGAGGGMGGMKRQQEGMERKDATPVVEITRLWAGRGMSASGRNRAAVGAHATNVASIFTAWAGLMGQWVRRRAARAWDACLGWRAILVRLRIQPGHRFARRWCHIPLFSFCYGHGLRWARGTNPKSLHRTVYMMMIQ